MVEMTRLELVSKNQSTNHYFLTSLVIFVLSTCLTLITNLGGSLKLLLLNIKIVLGNLYVGGPC